MNLKKIKIIAIISIFILTIIFHFTYELIPCFITSILFPVNESIWEHMKLLFTGTIVFSLVEYILLKKNNISFNNYFLSLFVSSVLSIIFYLMIYLPLYNYYGENIYISIGLLLYTIILFQIISYYILNSNKNYRVLNIISIILIIFTFIIFIYFTYYPIENYIFYDIVSNKYGIDKYK